jgi:hypothetical protein
MDDCCSYQIHGQEVPAPDTSVDYVDYEENVTAIQERGCEEIELLSPYKGTPVFQDQHQRPVPWRLLQRYGDGETVLHATSCIPLEERDDDSIFDYLEDWEVDWTNFGQQQTMGFNNGPE